MVGAGAAGLLAAIRAAERGRRTLLLEKNRRAGVKILMSGGTRCNITHATNNRGIVEAFGPGGRFLHSALAALSVQDTVALFEDEGVATKVESTGKIFPASNRAVDVLDALLRRLHRSGASLALEEPLLDLRRVQPGLSLITPQRTIAAANVILTVGGQSYPGSGTTGDGYAIAARLGHCIVSPRPALVPITVAAPWVGELRGVTVPDVSVAVQDKHQRLAHRRGSMLFAHFGLSGPVILDISRSVSGHPQPSDLTLGLDFCPDLPTSAVTDWLRTESVSSGRRQLASVLTERLPRHLGEVILGLAAMDRQRKATGLTKQERGLLVEAIKGLKVPVTGTLGFKKAEVTAGGVALDEVDSRTCASKRVPGLFIAGELLDLDGPIGGYNFQAAFSTGWLAGNSV